MLRQMVYTSEATGLLQQSDVFRIVQTSVTNNMSRDITGFLIYADPHFLQLIEGEQSQLTGLLDTLRADPRHKNIEILIAEPIAERRFPRWRMQRIGKNAGSIAEIRQTLTAVSGGRAIIRHVDRFVGAEVAR